MGNEIINEFGYVQDSPQDQPYLGYSWEDILRGYLPLSLIHHKISQTLMYSNSLTKDKATTILKGVILDVNAKYTHEKLKPLYTTKDGKIVCEGLAFEQRKTSNLPLLVQHAKRNNITKETIEYLKYAYNKIVNQPSPKESLISLFSGHEPTSGDKNTKKNLLTLIQCFDPNFGKRKTKYLPNTDTNSYSFTPGTIVIEQKEQLELGISQHNKPKKGSQSDQIIQHEEHENFQFDKKDTLVEKFETLLKPNDQIAINAHRINDIGGELYIINIKRINDVERDKTIVLYNGPHKSTYVIEGIMTLHDFSQQDLHGIYDQLSTMKHVARRFVMSNYQGESPIEDRCERIINQILTPDSIISNTNQDAIDMLKLVLMELKESDPDLIKRLLSQKSYPKAAHKINKILEQSHEYTYDHYLSTTSYASFLDSLKDPHFGDYSMHRNYIDYVLNGKTLMPQEEFKQLISSKLGNNNLQYAQQQIMNMKDFEYHNRAKEINQTLTKYYIFEARSYCLEYVSYKLFGN